MDNFSLIMDDLQKVIASISATNVTDNISRENLSAAIAKANLLFAELTKNDLYNDLTSKEAKCRDKELRDWLAFIGRLTNHLHQVVQHYTPNITQSIPGPSDLLGELYRGYDVYLVKLLKVIDLQKAEAYLSASLTLGIVAMELSYATYYNFNLMNTGEKIAAATGILLMFAGMNLLLASTVDTTIIPFTIPIGLVTLGSALCKRALVRNSNNAEIGATLALINSMNTQLDKVSNLRGIRNYFGKFFGYAMNPEQEKHKPVDSELEHTESTKIDSGINIVRRIKSGWRAFCNPD